MWRPITLATCTAAALLLTVGTGAHAQRGSRPTPAQLADAERFVRSTYASYRANTDPADLRGGEYSSRLTNLIAEGGELLAEGQGRGLDHDPVCACQDYGDIRVSRLRVTGTGARSADAAVSFSNLDGQNSLVLRLVLEGRRWVIDDIVDDGSLADELRVNARRIAAEQARRRRR